MGREATVFEINKTLDTLSYTDIGKAISYPMRKASGRNVIGESGVPIPLNFIPKKESIIIPDTEIAKLLKARNKSRKAGISVLSVQKN